MINQFWWQKEEIKKDSAQPVQVIPRMRYIQLKDTHVAMKGMVWEKSEFNPTYHPITIELMKVEQPTQWAEPRRAIEGNIEWFEELIPIYLNKEMLDKVGTLALKGK